MLNEALIRSLIDQHSEATRDERGDEDSLHVSDLMGCDREIWARVQGKGPMLPFGPERLRTFLFGFSAEDFVIDAIRQHTPVDEDVRVEFEGFLIGHPDGVTEDAVLEVKTTEFLVDRKTWQRIVPRVEADLALHYRIQTASYALALRKKRAFVIVICRATGLMAVIEIHPEMYRDMIMQRVERLRNLQRFMEFAPDVMPDYYLDPSTMNAKGESWKCKYCAFAGCPKNRNPLKES